MNRLEVLVAPKLPTFVFQPRVYVAGSRQHSSRAVEPDHEVANTGLPASTLSLRERVLLALGRIENPFTAKTLTQHLGCSRSAINEHLRALVDDGVLQRMPNNHYHTEGWDGH